VLKRCERFQLLVDVDVDVDVDVVVVVDVVVDGLFPTTITQSLISV